MSSNIRQANSPSSALLFPLGPQHAGETLLAGLPTCSVETLATPDYVTLAVSAGALGVGGIVYASLTCDGNWYAGDGVTETLGSGDALSVQASAAWGWVGDPTSSEPLAKDVDTFIDGTTFAIGVNILTAGVNFVVSPFAPGPQDGIEFYVSTPGLGVNGNEGTAVPLTGYKAPPTDSTCGAQGVIDTSAFQNLANIPNPPNVGYQVLVRQTSARQRSLGEEHRCT
jgi:hypothetical protein